MIVRDFAVSVQWGKGMHYFVDTDLASRKAADKLATNLREFHETHPRERGAKPTVYVWQRAPSIT